MAVNWYQRFLELFELVKGVMNFTSIWTRWPGRGFS